MPDRFAIAGITGAFGIKGYVKLRLASGRPGGLKKRQRVYVGPSADAAVETTVEDVIVHRQNVVVKLSAITNRTDAEARRGEMLFVGEGDLQAPPQNSYFIHDLVGCSVETSDGRLLGVLDEVFHSAGGDLWSVRGGEKKFLIPAVKEFIREVRIADRVIVVRTIEGLIESQE
ncbi:MAG TPA: ribosome maturation factor RimM [Bacteroidota bacterium]|nr:ribosome maturation factor RimM [Bacteroidota bacterium]